MRYVWSDEAKRRTGRGLVPVDELAPPPPRRAPAVHSDTTGPFRSMADGRIYESKSAYRQSLKRHGMVEVGNEISHLRSCSEPPDIPTETYVDAVKQAARKMGHDVL